MANIYIASKAMLINGVDTGKKHAYLFFDPDGSINSGRGVNGDKKIIQRKIFK